MKFRLNDKKGKNQVGSGGMSVGLRHYRDVLQRRIVEFKKEVVKTIYAWHVSDDGGLEHPWYSGCFRANWVVSVGDITHEENVNSKHDRPPRKNGDFSSADVAKGAFNAIINENGAEDFFNGKCQKTIVEMLNQTFYVVNNTWYGKWLNDGYFDDTTIIGQYPRSHHQNIHFNSKFLHQKQRNAPVDFMQTCLDDMKKKDWGAVMSDIRRKFNASQAQGHKK